MDGRGFPFSQQHVAAFLQTATDATLVMNTLPPMTLAQPSAYADYPAEAQTLVSKLANITTQEQLNEVRFFDGKLNIALGIIGTLLLGYGQSIEEIMLHSFGETTSVYDSGVAVYRRTSTQSHRSTLRRPLAADACSPSKCVCRLMNSRIRPTTVIQHLYPDFRFTVNNGFEVWGRHFQALVRVMPHSEFPSGSSCVCHAVEEFVTAFWPSLSLTMQGSPVVFDPASTPVVLPNTQMPTVPLTGALNPVASGYTAQTINRRCGETREEGGMHFTPAVPAGRALCNGMGAATAAKVKTLVPGLTDGTTTVRAAIGPTSPCESSCCASEVPCSTANASACASRCMGAWDMPWFDVVNARMLAFELPDRATATSTMAPFFQADRNHITIVGTMAALVPDILLSETIFQFRYTNTVDNLVWNSIAANSATLMALKYGQSREAQQPIVRSGHSSSDARVVTAVHAVAASLRLLLPSAVTPFQASLGAMVLSPTIGFDSGLKAVCGAPEAAATTFNATCLITWYEGSPSPARLGQVVAYEIMYFKVRDGWNSEGTDGQCDGGAHFCHRYADYTAWQPESGACLGETLGA
jgi:hypothetical protein